MKSDHPKPTGEPDIHDIVACVPHTEAAKIIAFHNAALAAERESRDYYHGETHTLAKQLAAERLKCDTAIENCMIHRRIATQLREQLADAEATIKSQDGLIDALGGAKEHKKCV